MNHDQTNRQRRTGRTGRTGTAGLRLTSLMDVTFLLLIFFVLTASFVVNEGVLKAKFEKSGVVDGPPRPVPDQFCIELNQLGHSDQVLITLQGYPRTLTNFEDLYQLLNGMRYDPVSNPGGMLMPEDTLVIKARPGTHWDQAVNAYNACVRTNHESICFASPNGSQLQ